VNVGDTLPSDRRPRSPTRRSSTLPLPVCVARHKLGDSAIHAQTKRV